MPLRTVGGRGPVVPPGAYVDDSALLIGRVTLGARTSVWPCALIRADDDEVELGDGSAVMDMAFVEAPRGRPVKIGDGCLVSHGARLHGCTLGDGVLVGVGAIVLDRATVGAGSVVAAGCLVPPGKDVPAGTVVAGVPAAEVRRASEEDAHSLSAELEVVRGKAQRYTAERTG